MIEANNDEVICPNCVTQFRAIPVNVQNELQDLRAALAERDALKAGARALLRQIDIGDFVDSHGHSAKMLSAVHDLTRSLK